MKIKRRIIVFDAADLDAESAFWAAMLGGAVVADADWHSVVVDGEWVLGVQHAPNHVPPEWPDGVQQQMHLDLWVDDLDEAEKKVTQAGGSYLTGRPTSPNSFYEAKYRNPDGVVFDLTHNGWAGATKEVVAKT